MQKIVIVSDNGIKLERNAKDYKVVYEKEFKLYDEALYITDLYDVADKLSRQGLAFIWAGDCNSNALYCIEDIQQVQDWYLYQAYAHMSGLPWKVYEDDGCIVREITVSDLPQLYEMYEKDGVVRYVEPLYGYEDEKFFTENYIRNMYGFYGYGLWLAFEKRTGRLIGRVGFSHREIDGKTQVELGYIIDADFQGKGWGYRLCSRLLEIGKSYWSFDEIFVCCDRENIRSIALARKLGFQYYGAYDNSCLYHLIIV